MKRDAQSAIIAGAGRYIRKLFGEVEPRLKKIEDELAGVPELLQRSLAELPPAKDGKDGNHGTSVTIADVEPILRSMVEALPRPKDGLDGKSVTLDELRPLVEGAVAALPVPKNGRDGLDGKSITVDEVLAALEQRIELAITKAVLEVERRAMDQVQRSIDKMPPPKDGKDGRDGFSLDDLQIEDDGDGTLSLRFVRGDLVRERSIRYPRGDRGIFREFEQCGIGGPAEPMDYRKGDGVTYGGSYWIAQKDAPQGKPGLSQDWRLAVKKGRDGRDGRDGIDKTLPVKI